MASSGKFPPKVASSLTSGSTKVWEKLYNWEDTSSVLAELEPTDLEFHIAGEVTPWTYLEQGRHLLALHLLKRLNAVMPSWFEVELALQTKGFAMQPHWKEFQLADSYDYLIRCLTGVFLDPPEYLQNDMGSAPVETKGHWRWASLPHLPFHAELGLIWALIGILNKDQKALDSAIKLAEWHMNTLDTDFKPFLGLFSKEELVAGGLVGAFNAFLYRILAEATNRDDFKYIAYKTGKHLEASLHSKQFHITPLIAVLSKLFDVPEEGLKKFELDKEIFDPALALIGLRTAEKRVILSLSGGGSGMGSLIKGDVEIITFGPQHAPLSDCTGFGIMGFSHVKGAEKKFAQIEQTADKMQIQGLCRLVPNKALSRTPATYLNGLPSNIWMDVKEVYQGEKLYIQIEFIGLKKEEETYFTFFVKAKECQVGEVKKIFPRSLDRYKGETVPLYLHGDNGQITFFSSFPGALEVIPLSGSGPFWGADLMISYKLSHLESKYSWVVE